MVSYFAGGVFSFACSQSDGDHVADYSAFTRCLSFAPLGGAGRFRSEKDSFGEGAVPDPRRYLRCVGAAGAAKRRSATPRQAVFFHLSAWAGGVRSDFLPMEIDPAARTLAA